ncbi:hypothetical protein NBRC3188_3309 [Acetobacter pasteurianus NBRC 3188]|uniref:Uncharacterized protein n=1 Tax=Acetobacter pasteurianus NBRC 3188 TaxID=1226663 RepID=A0A401WZ27_ACEPA|nr:hypothetical protein NBRC3188_3309 [Acetobacter pasteurianus NBRC 3188]
MQAYIVTKIRSMSGLGGGCSLSASQDTYSEADPSDILDAVQTRIGGRKQQWAG